VVLNNTTFFFPAGETIFVVGKSGSGKSTLSNLLMKYYESSKGEITIDGNPIQTLSQDWIRNNVSIVQQESVLFNETLFRNIAFGRQQHTTATRADVESACQTALLQQTINDLPDGLDTIISSGGDSMSGGQKQRVAIARARLRNSPILILDEATSALDPLTRTVVMEAIRHWRKGKSTIVITHDITQILLTDFVYVLDAGKIVQEGYRDRLEKVFDGPFSALLSRPADFCHSTPSLHRCSVSADSIYSVAESISSDQVYDRIAHLPSGLSRVSSFLAVKERTRPRSSYLTDRHRSLGMGSMLTTNLRTEVAWGDHTPSVALVRPKSYMNAEISKPTRTVRRSYRSFSIGDQGREDSFELVKITGQSSVAIRSGAAAHSGDIPTTPSMPHRQALSNTEKCTRQIKGDASIPKILKTVWPNLLWPDRLNLISGFLAAFINAACTPSFAYILSRLLNTYHLPNSPERSVLARNWAIVVLGIAIADGVTSYYFHWCLEYSGQVWVDTLRTEALKRILAQPKEWFDKKQNSPAALSEYLDRNAEEMRNLVGRFAGYVWMAFWMVAIAVIWAMIICWRLTLVGLASTPVMFVCTRIFENVAAKWERKTNESGEAASMIFTETFSNIRVVRALTLERYFRLKHSAATAQAYRIGIRRSLYTAFFFGLNDSTSIFVTALVLYYGTVLASTSYPISSVLAVITLLLFSSGNAGSILSLIPQISSSKTTATRVLYLANMAIRPKHELAGTKRLTDPLPIEFRNVNFTYPLRPTVQVLHNINLTFETGSCTAIVGSSGSGKSTIAALLLGLYPPNLPPSNLPTSSGNSTLFFAGVPLSNLHLPSLRSQISYVAQNPVLFPLTVGANISYGLRSPNSPSSLASQSNIQKAAHEAGIHEFIISLPQGYETIVGDGGMTLSGGQAQRVAIARALCRRPRVLVLDEATSALDGESARVIRDTIKKLAGRAAGTSRMRSSSNGGQRGDGMTVIAITHSVEMMRCLRNIVVLENGRVVEEGLFDELVTRGGIFENLVRSGEVEAGV
jgi:ATP-binding cassette subfamily B (MDR/TAP) protein 1